MTARYPELYPHPPGKALGPDMLLVTACQQTGKR